MEAGGISVALFASVPSLDFEDGVVELNLRNVGCHTICDLLSCHGRLLVVLARRRRAKADI